jgi:hypothetical protein
MEKENHNHHSKGRDKHYRNLIYMTILSFICMYVLMYAMVDRFSNVFPNINQFYMAGVMTMPMIIIEILLMRHMYLNKKLNFIFIGTGVVMLACFFLLIRQQTGVGDRQFVKSMIPHHAGALLMCEGADLKDPELKKLCEEIREGQQREIDQMKAILKRLNE